MENQFNHIEQIDLYLTNKMSVSDRTAFEKELETNEILRSDLEVQQELRDIVIISSLEDIRSMMKTDFEKQTITSNNRSKWYAFMGLSIVTLISGYFLYQTKENNNSIPIVDFKESTVVDYVKEDKSKDKSVDIAVLTIDDKEENIPLDSGINKVPKINRVLEIKQILPIVAEDSLDNKKPNDKTLDDIEVTKVEIGNVKLFEKVDSIDEKIIAPLTFGGEIKVVKTSYQEATGRIIINGDLAGGEKPYNYFVNDRNSQSSKIFDQLRADDYEVFGIDNKEDVILLAKITLEENLCVLEYNQSFVPVYDLSWEIPVVSDNDFYFNVYGLSGIVYDAYFESNDKSLWLGVNNEGQKLAAGYYRFEIKYSNGEQCLGELTIGN